MNREPRNTARQGQFARWAKGCLCLILLALSYWAGMAMAQQSITPPGSSGRTHDESNTNQTFSEAVWNIQNLSISGATASWACGPFVHSSYADRKADCRMSLRIVSANELANWILPTPTDATDYASGDSTAVVTARSSLAGGANVGLTVTFVQQDFSVLTVGDYRVTVTGTVSAN